MKTLKKTLAVILAILTIFTTCSVVMPVFAALETDEVEIADMAEETTEPVIVSEITDKRESNSKHFLMSDGTFMIAQYDSPVHYQDEESGKWIDIDNSVSKIEATAEQTDLFGTDELYATKNVADNVVFAEKSNSNTLVSYEAKDYPISMNYRSAKNRAIKIIEKENELEGNDYFLTLPNVTQEVIYEDVFDNVDLQYIVSPTQLKENIILKTKNAQNSFTLNYRIGELSAEVIDSRTINLVAGDEVVYTISAPYMYDANGGKSEDLTMTVEKNKNGKLTLVLTADGEWLNSEERAFPVVVDPTIITETEREAIDSVMIAEATPDTKYSGQAEMIVGREASTYGYCRVLAKISLPVLQDGDTVTSVEFNVLNYCTNYYSTDTPDMIVNAHTITGTWDSANVSWSSNLSFEAEVLDYVIFEPLTDSAVWRSFDVTKAAKEHYDTEDREFSIVLKSSNENGTYVQNGVFAGLYSERHTSVSDAHPQITVSYRNDIGLEDEWSYTTLNCGSAGVVNINNYSGNLVFTYNDNSSFDAAYNYNSIGTSDEFCGYAVSKSTSKFTQNLYRNPDETVTYPFVYTDEDGSKHYLSAIGSTESGMVLSYSNGIYRLVDENGNYRKFADGSGNMPIIEEGYLDGETEVATLQIEVSADDNTYTFSDSDENEISFIKDTVNNTLEVWENGKFMQKYTLSTEGYIISALNNDGEVATYTYDSLGRMVTVTDDKGYTLTFTYDENSKTVASVLESKNGDLGQKVAFSRMYNSTQVQTAGADGEFDNDDDLLTIYKFDEKARLIAVQNRTESEDLGAVVYEYGENTGSNFNGFGNVSKVSAVGRNVVNLLKNHNIESVDNWSIKTVSDNNVSYTAGLSTEKVYTGASSFKITTNDFTKNGSVSYVQTITPDSGLLVPTKTYTASVYVNTTGLTKDENVTSERGYGAGTVVSITTATDTKHVYATGVIETDDAINDGWERTFTSFTVPENYTKIEILLAVRNANGTVYFDGAQLEESDISDKYNLLENNGFDFVGTGNTPASWETSALESTDQIVNGEMKLSGNPGFLKTISQEVVLSNAKQTDSYTCSAWAKAHAVPFKENRNFAINAYVVYEDSNGNELVEQKGEYHFDYQDYTSQYASGGFTLANEDDTLTPVKIRVELRYYNQCNEVLFDRVALYRSPDVYDTQAYDDAETEEADPYTYDENGKILTYTDENGTVYTYTYDAAGNLISRLTADGKGDTYTYHDNGKLESEVCVADGITTTYNYDAIGNLTSESESTVTEGVITYISSSSYSYDDNNRLTAETSTDEQGVTTQYAYTYDDYDNLLTSSKNGVVIESFTYAYFDTNGDGIIDKSAVTGENLEDGTVNTYTYSAYNKLQRHTATKGGKTLAYNYDADGNLIKVEHNGFEYNYEYDAFGNITAVKVGNQSLISYEYQDDNSKVEKEIYGNGSQIEYTYNPYSQVYEKKSVGLGNVISKHDELGRLVFERDEPGEIKTYYQYDPEGRLYGEKVVTSAVGNQIENFLYSHMNALDDEGKVIKNSVTGGDRTATTTFTYTENGMPLQASLTSTRKVNFEYNDDDVLTTRTLTTNTPVAESFVYDDNGLVSSHTVTHGEDVDAYSYTYDDDGNITEIKKGGATQQSYVYDANNQLIRENNIDTGKTIVYTYDGYGNILSKNEYAYTLGDLGAVVDTVNYSYDTAWKDKLVSYDGQNITYDEIGNPTNYMGAQMTWFARQMQSYTKGNTSITYKYDSDGLRTQKTVNGVLHEYYYVDGKLQFEKKGDEYQIYYRYDSNGRPALAVKHDIAQAKNYYYYLITNTRGDVIETRNGDGNVNAKFTYDAWGKLVSVTDANGNALSQDSFAYQISLKYRGYVYDVETGLYYLQSRYYDPETGRFINADSATNFSKYSFNSVYAYRHYRKAIGNIAPGISFSPILLCITNIVSAVVNLLTVRYDVPLYSQGNHNLCWAYCQVMIEHFNAEIRWSQFVADDRAIEIAQTVNGVNWDRGGWPTNCRGYQENGVPVPADINSIFDLFLTLRREGPLYAYYCAEDNTTAHLVVVTGVDLLNRVVYTNNPWGVGGPQSYNEFLNGFLSATGDLVYPLNFYIIPA